MLKHYIELTRLNKPIGFFLLLWPNLWALYLASSSEPKLYLIVVFTLGVFLTRAAGCSINDYLDVEFDKKVQRTKNRPLALGLISKNSALFITAFLSLSAFILACYYLKVTTILLTIPALLIYITYPLMKRFFILPQAYLGIAFSFGILMVYIEVINQINTIAWLLFAANVCWVFGYDTIYALTDLKDDLNLNIKTSAIILKDKVVFFIAVSYIVFIALLVIIGIKLSLNGYYFISLALASVLLILQIISITNSDKNYLKMFLLNNWVGMIIFIGILLHFTLSY